MRHLLIVLLILLFAGLHHQAYCENSGCVRMQAEGDLVLRPGEERPSDLDAGNGVVFRLSPAARERPLSGPAHSWMRVAVLNRGNIVKNLPDSFYTGYSSFSSEHRLFWMIAEYTGGMHCCTRYHFLAKAAAYQPLRYEGSTLGSSSALEEDPLLCRDGAIYLKDSDIRFLYFHIAYADSRLEIPIYYRLTPSGLHIDNGPFRNEYLSEAASLDREFKALVATRNVKPLSILQENKDSRFFSDEAGQLLVKQAILHLYARDDRKAWETLDQGVKEYYKSTRGLVRIKSEIKKIMKASPY
jgi:hypothetical protein